MIGECAVHVDPYFIFVAPDAKLVGPEDLWIVSAVLAVTTNIPVLLFIVSDVPSTVLAYANASLVQSIDSDELCTVPIRFPVVSNVPNVILRVSNDPIVALVISNIPDVL
jgi:hypothetical protein